MNAAILLVVALTTQAFQVQSNEDMNLELRRLSEKNIITRKVIAMGSSGNDYDRQMLEISADHLRQVLGQRYNAKRAQAQGDSQKLQDLNDEYLDAFQRGINAIPKESLEHTTPAQHAAILKATEGATAAEWRASQQRRDDELSGPVRVDLENMRLVPVQPKQQRQPRKSVMKAENLTPAQLKERAQQERKDQLAKRRQRYQRSLAR